MHFVLTIRYVWKSFFLLQQPRPAMWWWQDRATSPGEWSYLTSLTCLHCRVIDQFYAQVPFGNHSSACSGGRIVSWIIYCWLVWCERKTLFPAGNLRSFTSKRIGCRSSRRNSATWWKAPRRSSRVQQQLNQEGRSRMVQLGNLGFAWVDEDRGERDGWMCGGKWMSRGIKRWEGAGIPPKSLVNFE